MQAILMKTFTPDEAAIICDNIGWRIRVGISPDFTSVTHMVVRHVVYFDNDHVFIDYVRNKLKNISPNGLAIGEWLNGNIPGKYSVQASIVLFEDYDDALLCYLRYKG